MRTDPRLLPSCVSALTWMQMDDAAHQMVEGGDSSPPSAQPARDRESRRVAQCSLTPPDLALVRDVQIETARGTLNMRHYRPYEEPRQGVLVWFHGGGFVCGSPHLSEDQVRHLALESGCDVVSVDYSLAPEFKFPTAVEECYRAVRWVAKHQSDLGIAGGLAVGGDSAGGNLAAATTLMSRDRGGPVIDFQVLVYPTTSIDIDTESRREFAVGYGLEIERERHPSYLRSRIDALNPLASPLLAESFADLPSALIVTSECDPLRDEGELYARRLIEAGVVVEMRRYEGQIHGFWAYAGIIPEALTSIRWVGDKLGNALRSPQ